MGREGVILWLIKVYLHMLYPTPSPFSKAIKKGLVPCGSQILDITGYMWKSNKNSALTQYNPNEYMVKGEVVTFLFLCKHISSQPWGRELARQLGQREVGCQIQAMRSDN